MANIKKIVGKTGISYQITVCKGVGYDGKQIRHYKTWKVPQGMTESKANKTVHDVAYEFEKSFDDGYVADCKYTFAEYAEYVLGNKAREVRPRTIEIYHDRLKRINPAIGHFKLTELTTEKINVFYGNLCEKGIRCDGIKATLKAGVDIPNLLKDKGLTLTAIADQTGISQANLSLAKNGKTVGIKTADALSKALGFKTEKLFDVFKNTAKLAPATIEKYHQLIVLVLEQAVAERYIKYNPALSATISKVETDNEKEIFSPEEIWQIQECLKNEDMKWSTLVNLLIATGARRGEIAGLKWDDIDWERNIIHIERALYWSKDEGTHEIPPKTKKSKRDIALAPEMMSMLKQYQGYYYGLILACGDEWNDTGYVFTRDNGLPLNPTSITQWLDNFSKRYNLVHINPHKFRHTFASVAINNGADAESVATVLGHTQMSTTDKYVHPLDNSKAKVANAVADVLLRRQA